MKARATGFTLIEVLIALAILAIALVAVIKVMGQSVVATQHVENKLESHWVAMNVLSSYEVGLITLSKDGEANGHESLMNREWYWTLEKTQKSKGLPTPVRVKVALSENGSTIDSMVSFLAESKQ